MMAKAGRLRITEIFYSLQGETRTSGCPTVFIRLTGCPLRCTYCDTEYAFAGGDWWSLDDIVSKVEEYGARYVTVTGGEPLAQSACLMLLDRLCGLGFDVSLETSGALSVAGVARGVSRIVDVKTPGSGECDKNLVENYALLGRNDQIKFVIGSYKDYEWSKSYIAEHVLLDICEVWFSCSFGEVSSVDLAEWILRDRLQVRFQLQLHKLLWADEPGR